MKNIIEYINENLVLEALSAEDIVKKLPDDKDLPSFVKDLNNALGDSDCRKVLNAAFGMYKGDDAIDFDINQKDIEVVVLHPTQNEIDVDKSIAYPFKHDSKKNMERYYIDDVCEMPFPLITFNGEWVIDGHHRWSQVYAFNPKAKMHCLDITVASSQKLSATDVLKITQGFLAAKAAKYKAKSLPSSKAGTINVLKDDVKKIVARVKEIAAQNPDNSVVIAKYINEYYTKNNKELLEFCDKDNASKFLELCKSLGEDKTEGDDRFDGIAGILASALGKMQADNKKFSNNPNSRDVMPQTDRGGDDPEDGKAADIKVDGSALNNMAKGKINPKVVNK